MLHPKPSVCTATSRVEAACGNELGMRAHLDDPAVIKHGDLVGVRHGAQAMRYDEH